MIKYLFVYGISVLSGLALGQYLWYNPHPIEGHVYKRLGLVQTQEDKVFVLKSMSGKVFLYEGEAKNSEFYLMHKDGLKPLIDQPNIFGE